MNGLLQPLAAPARRGRKRPERSATKKRRSAAPPLRQTARPRALRHGDGRILDHVFLPAHHAAAAQLHQDVPGRYAVLDAGALGEEQEGTIHPGVAQGQGVTVDADREVHDRHHQVFGHVGDLGHIHPGLDAHQVGHGDEDFHRGVAGPGAQAGSGGVDARGAHFDGGDAVGHAHGQVVVAMKAQLGLGLEGGAHGAEARLDAIRQQVAGGVGDVDAVGAVALHQPGLLDQAFGAVHVGHHQKADGVHVELSGQGDVLFGHIGLGAVGGDADGVHPQVAGHAQVIDGADAGQQQGRDLGLLHARDDGAQVFLVGVGREAVVHRAAPQAVAVGDFDQRHAGCVEPGGDADHLIEGHEVTLGVHAVPQGHVVDGNFGAFEIHGGFSDDSMVG
jgi:hypothetical protein